jgi:hypothetical protein
MTHVTDPRAVHDHSDMGESAPAGSRKSLTVKEIVRRGLRSRAGHDEMAAAQSEWDAEGGATGIGESLPRGPGR